MFQTCHPYLNKKMINKIKYPEANYFIPDLSVTQLLCKAYLSLSRIAE
jgi:hypothetical protein